MLFPPCHPVKEGWTPLISPVSHQKEDLGNTVYLLMFLFEMDIYGVLQNFCLSFYLLNIIFLKIHHLSLYEPWPSSPWYLGLLNKPPPYLLMVLAVDTRGAPTFLPRSQALPASSYVVQALSACLGGTWSHHTHRGLDLLPSPASDVNTSGAHLKDTQSISRHIKRPCVPPDTITVPDFRGSGSRSPDLCLLA